MNLIQIVAVTPTKRARLAWISTLTDGSVSVGLNDRLFRAERAETVDPAGQPTEIDWTKIRSQRAMVNPHFTYHPDSELTHLRAEDRPSLYSCLYPVRMLLQEQEVVEWVTWWTRALPDLPPAGADDRPSSEVRDLAVSADDCSIELRAAFVLPGTPPRSVRGALVVPLLGMQLCLSTTASRPGTPGFRFQHFT